MLLLSRLGGCTVSLVRCHKLFNIRDVIVVDVDQALALVDVAHEYFNSDPFLELLRF